MRISNIFNSILELCDDIENDSGSKDVSDVLIKIRGWIENYILEHKDDLNF